MDNPHKGRTGLDRIRHAAGYLAAGPGSAPTPGTRAPLRRDHGRTLMLLLAWLTDLVEVALLAGSVVMVMAVELLNSAVEATVDRIL